MGSGSSGSNGAPTGQTNAPWKGAKPYVKEVYGDLDALYGKPMEYYPGDTLADTDPASIAAMQARYDRATGGSDLTRGSQEYVGNVLRGDYLTSNPWLDRTYDNAAKSVTRSFNTTTMPTLDARFAGSGRTGGGAYKYALNRANQNLAGELSSLADTIYARNYETERGRQDSASRFAPVLAEYDYNDIDQLKAVGSEREGRAQSEIDELIKRFEFAQEEPWARAERFLSDLTAGNYGQTNVNRGHMDNGRTVWSDIGSFLGALA